ncbi:MAG TPA: hypothetical protein VMA77_18710 [Solirubrobacteraceae bacterium]|nr:hypothetical protein [Solirubrobacteraceae bacterium]
MERNQKTLSTRDLAMGNDPVADANPASALAPDDREPPGEASTDVYDHEAAGHEPAIGPRESTDSPARDIRSQPEPAGRDGEHGNTPAQSALADTEASPPASTAGPAGAILSSGVNVTASRAQNVPAPASPADSSETPSANGNPLLSEELSMTFQRRWEEVQTRFVDEPRGAVEDADGLVANLMQQLAQGFAQERERLEAQWGRGEDFSTEDLRVALQRYRSFFQRLLST